jgi:hypothetical protein
MDDEFKADLEYARLHGSPDLITAHQCRMCGKCAGEHIEKLEQVSGPPQTPPEAELEILTPARIRDGEVSKTSMEKDKNLPGEDGEFGPGDRGEVVMLKSEDGLELIDPATNKRGDISR